MLLSKCYFSGRLEFRCQLTVAEHIFELSTTSKLAVPLENNWVCELCFFRCVSGGGLVDEFNSGTWRPSPCPYSVGR
jgi:hypothetical protein